MSSGNISCHTGQDISEVRTPDAISAALLEALADKEATLAALNSERLRSENAEFMLRQQQGWGVIANAELVRLNADLLLAKQRVSTLECELATLKSIAADERSRYADDDIARTLNRLTRFSRAGVPLFVRDDLRLAFSNGPERSSERVAVVTIPKAGTYLLGAILHELGFVDSGIHAAEWGFNDRRRLQGFNAIERITEGNIVIPISEYIDLIQPGQYVLSHLPPTAEIRRLLSGYKMFLALRDPRDCFVSFMRFAARISGNKSGLAAISDGPERMEAYIRSEEGLNFFKIATPMIGWLNEPGVPVIRYEEIMGDYGVHVAARAICSICAYVAPEGSSGFDLDKIISTPTLTSSGARTNWRHWWSAKIEEYYIAQGGLELAAAMGYREARS